MTQAGMGSNLNSLVNDMRSLMGEANVITDEKEREFFSTDIFYKAENVA